MLSSDKYVYPVPLSLLLQFQANLGMSENTDHTELKLLKSISSFQKCLSTCQKSERLFNSLMAFTCSKSTIRNTRTSCEICLKLIIKTPGQGQY